MTDRWLSQDQQRSWRSYLLGTTLLMDHLDRDLREKHGLSLPEYEILVRLSESPCRTLRMAELAHSVKNSRSRITHTVKRLEQDGYVERRACESDGRGVIASLTERGFERLTVAAHDHVEAVREALVDLVTDEQLATIGSAFRAVSDRLETGTPDPLLSTVRTP
jgi:DNA-binding MarR family transcriptional regulator